LAVVVLGVAVPASGDPLPMPVPAETIAGEMKSATVAAAKINMRMLSSPKFFQFHRTTLIGAARAKVSSLPTLHLEIHSKINILLHCTGTTLLC
jgi:hypothetical protein